MIVTSQEKEYFTRKLIDRNLTQPGNFKIHSAHMEGVIGRTATHPQPRWGISFPSSETNRPPKLIKSVRMSVWRTQSTSMVWRAGARLCIFQLGCYFFVCLFSSTHRTYIFDHMLSHKARVNSCKEGKSYRPSTAKHQVTPQKTVPELVRCNWNRTDPH